MRLQRGGELGALRFQHRDVVFDAQGVQRLAAEAVGNDAGLDALARRVHGRGRAGGSATDDQHVERRLLVQFGRFAVGGIDVQLGHDFFERHAPGTEQRVILEYHRHRHHLALVDFILVHAAIDDDGIDIRVIDCHQRGGLHHVGAVVAGEGHVHLEVATVQRPDLVKYFRFHFRRMAAGPQQGQHQRGEFVTEGNGGKAHAARFALFGDHERW